MFSITTLTFSITNIHTFLFLFYCASASVIQYYICLNFLGISYSVNAQELLVQRCLEDDQQLLEALAPDPLLESDLLTLDDTTLKSELNDELDMSQPVTVTTIEQSNVNPYVNTFTTSASTVKELDNLNHCTVETRKRTRNSIFEDDQLCKFC